MEQQIEFQTVINSLSQQVQDYSVKLAYQAAVSQQLQKEKDELTKELEELRKQQIEEMDKNSDH
ncbi:hypothetical protein [Virgibacillus salexigens]|uniref:Uncharacterized protein n=1 Tax=Virgibacillus massiliensis TaxID=1462526 RepID=A0A024QCA7_9BACI|nr:hypothetical protein [Virgibacillus massiliensis]CDQ39561.1 hypothetical protein BN990_01866 [Virgibacillus massiliensis]